MNFRELINKLDQINEAEELTLQSIAAVEKAAMDKAVAEKAKGGFSGFAAWDPRSAGNIALAKLAQQNNFEGLFNSEGDFVVAYGNKTWSSNSEMHPGENPRIAPPTPDDWKPLAAKGLIPQNAKGPAGLTNWLTSGGAQKEFDAVKKQSADVAGGTVAGASPAQGAKVSSADEEAKMTQLEGLVDQYLKLKAGIKTGTKPVKGPEGKTEPEKKAEIDQTKKVDQTEPSNGTGLKLPKGTENPIGATLSKRVADLDPTGSKVDYRLDPEGKAKLNAMNENSIAQSLVESFGYQKKTVLKPFDFNLKETKDADFDPDEYLRNKYGDPNDTDSGRVDRRSWQEKNIITTIPNAIWKEGSLTWEDEIIPGVYNFKDLGWDLGITAGIVVAGAIMAPFTGGASAVVAGGLIVRNLIRVARVIQRFVTTAGKPFWELVKGNVGNFRKEITKIAMKMWNKFWELLATEFSSKALSYTILITLGFNGAAELLKAHWPEGYKATTDARDWALDKARPAVDWVRKKTGIEEGLQ